MSALIELAEKVSALEDEINTQKVAETNESATPDYNIAEGEVTIPTWHTLETFLYLGGSTVAITTSGTGVFTVNGTAVNIDFSVV